MARAIRSRLFTLSPTKANQKRLTDVKLIIVQLHDQSIKIHEDIEHIMTQIEAIKSFLQ